MAVAFGIGDMLPVREAKPAPVPATQQADTANQEQGANRPVAA